MSVLIFILVNSKDKLNQKKEKVRDFTPIYSELSRKHKLVSSVWTAIDTKIGVLLGLIVVWLLGIIRSKDIISSIANNTFQHRRQILRSHLYQILLCVPFFGFLSGPSSSQYV